MVAFPHPVRLEGERSDKKTVWFKVDRNENPEDTRDQAWEWFGEVSRRYAQQVMGPEATGQSPGYGPYDTKGEDGKYYHGSAAKPRLFRVVSKPALGDGGVRVMDWDARTCTTDSAEVFCGNCKLSERVGSDRIYEHLGHEVLGRDGLALVPAVTGNRGQALHAPVRVEAREPVPWHPGEFDY